MIKSNLDFSLKLFFILLPFCYIIGPAAININIFILFLNFLLLKVIEKKFNLLNFIKRKEVFIFLLFYIYINLLSFLSDDIIFSLKSTIPFIKFLFLILIINYLISNNLFKIKVILLFFSSIFLFILIDSLVQFFFGYNLLFFKSIYNQYTGIFRDEQILGSYVSRYLPIFSISYGVD